ncbi:MAG TPA: signal peptidase I [Candidatus Limnocylindrales bacterium]
MSEAAPIDAPGPAAPRRRRWHWLVEVVETLLLTALIFVGIQTFVAQPFKVEGQSMESTLLPDQYVLIDKLTPHWAPYARGDIVVLDPPVPQAVSNGTPFIKRVIGLPGDRVELKGGVVYVNGTALDEPYVFTENGVRQPTDDISAGQTTWLVPPGQLLVMGDHRQASEDSRVFGPVEISHIIGRAWLRYWPFDSFGTLTAPSYAAATAGP